MNESSPISNPATTPAKLQMINPVYFTEKKIGEFIFTSEEADFCAVSKTRHLKLSTLSISKPLPRETISAMSAQATAPALAWASATRHAMFPTGTSAVHSQVYKVHKG